MNETQGSRKKLARRALTWLVGIFTAVVTALIVTYLPKFLSGPEHSLKVNFWYGTLSFTTDCEIRRGPITLDLSSIVGEKPPPGVAREYKSLATPGLTFKNAGKDGLNNLKVTLFFAFDVSLSPPPETDKMVLDNVALFRQQNPQKCETFNRGRVVFDIAAFTFGRYFEPSEISVHGSKMSFFIEHLNPNEYIDLKLCNTHYGRLRSCGGNINYIEADVLVRSDELTFHKVLIIRCEPRLPGLHDVECRNFEATVSN